MEKTPLLLKKIGRSCPFRSSSDWGSGTHESKSIAAEQKADGSYAIAIKNTNIDTYGKHIQWQILNVSKDGIVSRDYESEILTEDISLYEESIFNQDLDGDGAIGIDLEITSSRQPLTQIITEIYFIKIDKLEHFLFLIIRILNQR